VLGYDDEVSQDHDFGPRVQVFLPPDVDPTSVHAALERLPERFDGYPVGFARGGRTGHHVEVTTVAAFFTGALRTDPVDGMGLADWLLTPTQRLASLTAGAVFHDPDRALGRRRAALAWYPDDVWRYVLAAQWHRIGEEEAFVGRTGGSGDELGSAIVGARLVRDLVRLAYLIERRWAPYSKWLGRGFTELALAEEVGTGLRAALAAATWREREAALTDATSRLGMATNRLGLADAVDPHPRRFYTRAIQVVGAERFTEALTAAITDPELRALLDRHRPAGRLPGAIDQAVDSVDVLSHPDRCRAAAGLLGLTGG
jgi:hypothetical protein